MTRNELLEQMRISLGLPEGGLTIKDSQETIDEWDSLGHLALVAMLHEKFALDGSDEELRSFRSVEALFIRLTDLGLIED